MWATPVRREQFCTRLDDVKAADRGHACRVPSAGLSFVLEVLAVLELLEGMLECSKVNLLYYTYYALRG